MSMIDTVVSQHEARVLGITSRFSSASKKARVRLARQVRKSHYRVIRFLSPPEGASAEFAAGCKKEVEKFTQGHPLPSWAELPKASKK